MQGKRDRRQQIAKMFAVACRRAGIPEHGPKLSTAAFRRHWVRRWNYSDPAGRSLNGNCHKFSATTSPSRRLFVTKPAAFSRIGGRMKFRQARRGFAVSHYRMLVSLHHRHNGGMLLPALSKARAQASRQLRKLAAPHGDCLHHVHG